LDQGDVSLHHSLGFQGPTPPASRMVIDELIDSPYAISLDHPYNSTFK